ncbi:MAG: chemotaxis response regulator protein-glutamate methylesterase [Verrucomicrobiae bacterium]|nr:chemotaxis response regulator protein-glutamate methylesterase [Verrucomicrobiae bacterium]
MITTKKIRVLIVDDSAIVRKLVTESLSHDPQIEVVGTAIDPYVARDKILSLKPDVLTLDIEMPRMDGITFLKILMKHHPMPIIILSSLTQSGSMRALEAMQSGAVDVLGKPSSSYSIGELGSVLAEKVKAAAVARISRLAKPEASETAVTEAPPSRVISKQIHYPRQVILLGASTGGTEALKEVLTRLPDNLPGICIVQHIPAYFSKAFADRLNNICAMEVREAVDGDRVKPGLALVAPGNYHMLLQWHVDQYWVHLKQGPPVWHQRPAVDVLFNSASDCAKEHAVAALFTGMGRDGAEGMLKLKQAGAQTIAQNEETCVVFGMPRAAIELGAADHVLPLLEIPQALVNLSAVASQRMKNKSAV